MEEQGLWALFWATGLPEAWLTIREPAQPRLEEDAIVCAPPPGETDGL